VFFDFVVVFGWVAKFISVCLNKDFRSEISDLEITVFGKFLICFEQEIASRVHTL
jgi:hypothetical protein